ncbi:type II toxin-antitoxin system RelE/ParE family toxin [Comamonas thiooxydans]|uniref:type II toxin-antitoxin system RelE/ParE family toxin n=1 Tax=Comamonas thiooxydans TaxID=363952 RepID=UPI00209C32C7|nr:type II toxin-antitoxin system RelE/ParE family toxin [Comamonas thiooxydans]
MTKALYRVAVTDNFLVQLDATETFLAETVAGVADDNLLASLRRAVVPNLARFPLMGRRYLDQPPQSVEGLERLSKLPAGAADSLRVYLHDDYLMLYSVINEVVYLLSIRHHRQMSFDFSGFWPA